MSWLGSFFGGKKTTTSIDPASQAYLDQSRGQAQAAAGTALNGPAGGGSWFTGPQQMSIGNQAAQFFNPYMSNVVDATKQQYDQLRGQAVNQGNTIPQGAFGGIRAALAQGARLGQLDVGQANQISGLLNSGYQNALQQGTAYTEQQRQLQQQQQMEPLFRAQQAQGFQNAGMGPYGQTTSSSGGGFGSLIQGAAGLASIGSGLGLFGGGGANAASLGGISGGYGPGGMPQNPNMYGGPQQMPGATSWLGGQQFQPRY